MGLRPEPAATPRLLGRLDPSRPDQRRPDLNPLSGKVRVVRPRDLLAFDASWTGMTLERETSPEFVRTHGPRLVAGPNGGLLTFEFSFQHIAEGATTPDFVGDESLDFVVPIPARAARPSRLVFKVPAGGAVEYSTAGLLAAMSTLEPAVAPAATPAPEFVPWWLGSIGLGTITARVFATAIRGRATSVQIDTGQRRLTAIDLIESQRGLVASNRLISRGILTAAAGPVLGRQPRATLPALPAPRAPRPDETAIEAPFRLILSPSPLGGWAHARQPVAARDDPGRVELWHSRLGVREADGVDEVSTGQRVVRAIWTRDRDPGRSTGLGLSDPFPHSLTAVHRELIVRQSAGTAQVPDAIPKPVSVRRLALSSLGAWLDLHVRWDFEQYLGPNGFSPLASWDHVAPMGRDQFVRIVRPGYLFPLGHRAFLVEITYRKIVGAANPQAALFKRRFIELGDPARAFTRRDLPFVAATLGPLRTPDLKDPGVATTPGPPPSTAPAGAEAALPVPQPFWPTPLGETTPLLWSIDASDQDGEPIKLKAPLLFVFADPRNDFAAIVEKYATKSTIPADSQTIAFAPALAASEGIASARASAETQELVLGGVAATASSEPFLTRARVVIPAIQRLTPSAPPADVSYPKIYKDSGFEPANVGNVYLELKVPTELVFGSSENSGGFVKPDVAVAGLARSNGLVADIEAAVKGEFTAAKLFASGGLPKLFGLFDLTEIIADGVLGRAPEFVTQDLNRVAALLLDLDKLAAAATGAGLAPQLPGKVDVVQAEIEKLLKGDAEAIGTVDIGTALDAVATEVTGLVAAVPGAGLDPLARSIFDRLLGGLQPALAAADKLTAILAFAQGFDPGGAEFRTGFEWRPEVKNFPATGDAIFQVDDAFNALAISIEARASASGSPGIEIGAQLSNFSLNLLPGAPLMRIKFDRLAFRSGTGRKPDVDVVFGGIEFVGILGFIEVLKELIPLDGFSDPPFLDISAEGVSAGFTVALPNAAVGIMSLSNLSLAADARIPFLGKAVSVGFSFCTRERPFTLAVFPLGGGGFVGIRLDPSGLILLEAAFEFGAVVAINFGVASGSVSIMAGIYFRLEGKDGSLTGYLRIRGEVDVLGLISASIELYMALTYQFNTGKMIGEASIKVCVEVLFFSTSVTIRAQRTFAGSNGDPTARQMLLVDAAGNSAVWDQYCTAFAPAAEA